MFGMVMLDISPSYLYSYFSNLNTGHAALLGSMVIGICYYLGNLFDWFIIIIVDYSMKVFGMKSKQISDVKKLSTNDNDKIKDLANVYIDKAFLRSIFLAGLGIIFFLICLDTKYNSNQACSTIIIIGGLIEIINLITIIYLMTKYSALWVELINNDI